MQKLEEEEKKKEAIEDRRAVRCSEAKGHVRFLQASIQTNYG